MDVPIFVLRPLDALYACPALGAVGYAHVAPRVLSLVEAISFATVKVLSALNVPLSAGAHGYVTNSPTLSNLLHQKRRSNEHQGKL